MMNLGDHCLLFLGKDIMEDLHSSFNHMFFLPGFLRNEIPAVRALKELVYLTADAYREIHDQEN
jgi:hypothetical protein